MQPNLFLKIAGVILQSLIIDTGESFLFIFWGGAGAGWYWSCIFHLPPSPPNISFIVYYATLTGSIVYCLLTWVVSTFVGRILSQCSPWHPFFVHHVEGVTRHRRHACIRFVPPMYLLFIPHQKSNGCCISDRHLPSYPIRQAYLVYYFPSCTFTMPYSFWQVSPPKSSANNSTEHLLPGSPCQYLFHVSNAIIILLCQCVAENEHAGNWTPDPSISRRVCYHYTTGHVQDTQLSFPVADIRSCSECWHCLLTHTADIYRYSDEAAVWHADRAPTIILFSIGQWCWIGTLLKGTVITVLHHGYSIALICL